MSSRKETPPFRLNLANAAARKIDPEDPRLMRLIDDAEPPAANPGTDPTTEADRDLHVSDPVPRTNTPTSLNPERDGAGRSRAPSPAPGRTGGAGRSSAHGTTMTITAAPPTQAPRRTRHVARPTIRISVAVDGPLPWETLGELADTQRNMNLRLTEADLQKLQWLAQCLPGTSIQKICREAIRSYVDARIRELIPPH